MKFLSTTLLAAAMFSGSAITGCESHTTETDKPGLFGGNTHTKDTTTHNDVTGDTSTSHQQTKTP